MNMKETNKRLDKIHAATAESFDALCDKFGRILVRLPDNHQRGYRLWDDANDRWLSNSLSEDGMIDLLMEDGTSHEDAFNQVHRIGFDDYVVRYLQDYFDKRVGALNRKDRKHHN